MQVNDLVNKRLRVENQVKVGLALQTAIFNSANFSSIATDEKGVIQIFNVGAERMLGYTAADVMNKITPADISDPQEVIERAQALSQELGTTIAPGFEALVFKASRGIEDIYELTYIRKDGSRFPAVVSVTALRDGQDGIIGYLLIGTDNTARQRAELAAKLLAAVVESSSDAVIGKDLNSIVTSWNAAAEKMFGYTADEMVGQPITLIIPANRHGDEEQILSTIRRGERVEHFETERLSKQGTLVAVSVTVSPIKDSRGRVIGASKVARDITGRKRVEDALRESEERFRLLVEGVHEYAIILLDPAGNVISWNAGAERIKGYKSEEIIGRSFSVFYPPQDVAAGKPAAELGVAAQQGRWEGEGWRVRADGTRFWANVLITALKDDAGKLRGFSKLTRDITERKQAEEALLKAGALQRAIFNSANFSSIATDARGVIQIFNVGAERMLGYTAAEVMNKITPADISDPQELIARAQELSLQLAIPITPGFEALVFKASRGIEDIYELTYIRKDGSRFPAVVSVTALRDAQDAIIGYLLIGTDNAERKRAADVIRQLHADMEQRVVERTAQLLTANNELEAFTYSVSHDLRAPLRSIDGFSQALLEDCADKLDAEGQDSLGRIRRASQRMGHLIDDLLNLSRLTRVEMVRQTVDLSKVAREVAAELRAGDPLREVYFVIPEGLVTQADPQLLRIALTNLFSNAWKFTAKRQDARVEFGCAGEDGNKAFFVSDNGVGFDMAYARKLFGAFQRLHAMKDFSGTGIGLVTVQRIVHRHGGRVWAEARVDAGATFHFTLAPAA